MTDTLTVPHPLGPDRDAPRPLRPLARANEGPDTFSPFDVVGHLVEGEETDDSTVTR